MPIEYDVKEDAFFKEGVEYGKEEERRKVEEERRKVEEERSLEKRNLIIKLIKSEKHNFQEIAEIMDVKVSYIKEISGNI